MTSTTLTPEQRSQRARIGALKLHASGKTNTAAARAAFAERFYAGIPEDLPAAERDRRAAFAKRLYFAELALKSSRVRGARNRKPAPVGEMTGSGQEGRRRDRRPDAA